MIVREVLAHFGVSTDGEGALRQMSAFLDISKGRAEALAGALGRLAGVFAAAAGTVALVHSQAQAADAIGDTAAAVGISTNALQEWQYVATLSGSSAEEMSNSLMLLGRSLAAAGEGGKEQSQALRRLGVDYRNADGSIRPMEQILDGIVDGFSGVEGQTQRVALATRLFGRQGARLVPLLSQGREGVAALRREFQELGGGASPEAIAAAAEYNDNLDRLSTSFFGLGQRIANFFLPSFVRILDAFTSGARAVFSFVDRTHLVQAALVTMLGAMVAIGVPAAASLVAAFGPIIVTALLVAAGIAAVVLAVDDVLTLFSGGQSVIGDFLDELLGVGTAAQVVAVMSDSLRVVWEQIHNAISMAVEAAQGGMRIFRAVVGTADDASEGRGILDRVRGALGENLAAHSDASAQRGVAATTARVNQSVIDAQRASETPVFGRAFLADTGASATSFAGGSTGARTVTAPAPARGGDTITTVGETRVEISVPPGTTPEQTRHIRQVISDTLSERDRKALAAMQRQRVEE